MLRDCFGSLSTRLAGVLERLWNRFGASWIILERLGASLEASLERLGASCLGGVLRRPEKVLEHGFSRR